jgi:photosystem II stability/assembly factor-like uncharacterized protein
MDNFGTGVSYVYDEDGYNYERVVFQKGKPPFDSEFNAAQGYESLLRGRQLADLPSGWMTIYPFYTDPTITNGFYTQDTDNALPEYALVNGNVLHVTSTGTTTTNTLPNTNLIQLEAPPASGNVVDGVILECWKALLYADSTMSGTAIVKPPVANVNDSFNGLHMVDATTGWICGENGLLLKTEDSGTVWGSIAINTTTTLNSIYFINKNVGWTCGNNGTIAQTTTAGTSWFFPVTNITENLNSISAVNANSAWSVGDGGVILTTSTPNSYGVTWVAQNSGVTSNLNSIYFHDTLVGWAVGDGGVILKTTSGGANWMKLSSGVTTKLNGVFFYDLNYGFAVGDNGMILRSSDGGLSWVNQSNNIYVDSSYTSITQNLNAIAMVPTLDRLITNEEVSSQLGGTGTSFVVSKGKITLGDGNGTVTNLVSAVTVTVNDSTASVNQVIGSTGTVVLNSAPGYGAVTKITYNYAENDAVFYGRAWIAGDTGTVLYTSAPYDNTSINGIGAQWLPRKTETSYDLNAINFLNQNMGWFVGSQSEIGYTIDAGTNWTKQTPGVDARTVQQVFYEGNIGTTKYLVDESIHPDAAIETSERVQIQYKIRVIESVDPSAHPEAGLNPSILGIGPNATGTYFYENMGLINGDYGCWRAQCANTIDGYVYAIPMFFVNRRNSTNYNLSSNPNGTSTPNSIRPDLLTATEVTDSDILDVRRQIIVPSATELLDKNFDALMSNSMRTNFGMSVNNGHISYGTELLQVDRVGGTDTDGGTKIDINLAGAISGGISSKVTINSTLDPYAAYNSFPINYKLSAPSGSLFSSDPAKYKAVYNSSNLTFNGKSVPGYFTGFGTGNIQFIFDNATNTKITDTGLASYDITCEYITSSLTCLTQIPSMPQLVQNYSGTTGSPFYYRGILDTDTSRVIESWDSGIVGYESYALVYTTQPHTDSTQNYRASNVEVHYRMRTDNNIDINGDLKVPLNIKSDLSNFGYNVYTVSNIINITSSSSYQISNIKTDSTNLLITPNAGYEFIPGAVLEVVASVTSNADGNPKNGANVNFNSTVKSVHNFTKSIIVTQFGSLTLISDGIILGCSATKTNAALVQPIYWKKTGNNTPVMVQVSVSEFGLNTLTITDPGFNPVTDTAIIQLLVQETQFTYPNANNNDGLLISYNYTIPQTQSNLTSNLNVKIITSPAYMYITNIGVGGGNTGDPYITPCQHIPANSTYGDEILNNIESLIFSSYKIDSGLAKVPINITSKLGNISLSGVSVDKMARYFYSSVSEKLNWACEGLQVSQPRKVFIPVIAEIIETENNIFSLGEEILIIFSSLIISGSNNYFGRSMSCSIYRINNRPIIK